MKNDRQTKIDPNSCLWLLLLYGPQESKEFCDDCGIFEGTTKIEHQNNKI